MGDWVWLDDAACLKNPALMDQSCFGELYQQEQFKRTFCKTCPVAFDCLRHALRFGMWDGVFGGMTVAERSRFDMKHRRASPKAKTAHAEHIASIK